MVKNGNQVYKTYHSFSHPHRQYIHPRIYSCRCHAHLYTQNYPHILVGWLHMNLYTITVQYMLLCFSSFLQCFMNHPMHG